MKIKKLTIAIICCLMLCVLSGCSENKNTLSYKYGNQVIEILNHYKDNKLEAKEAAKQIDEIRDILHSEGNRIKNENFDEGHKLSMIAYECDSAYTDLKYSESMSLTKINQSIENIKKQMN